jgi:hypothetical protein
MEKSPNFFHNGEQIFLPNSHGKKDNLIKTYSNLLKIRFRKRTHVFDNTMTSPRKLFREKDSVTVIKTQKSHHKTKFLIICNNPRIASMKTQSSFCNKTSFAKDKIQKRRTFHDIKVEIDFFLKQKFVSKLSTFKNHPKVMKFQKIVKKEVTGH